MAFIDNNGLIECLRTHIREKLYQCSMCDKNFSRAHHLKRNLKTHTRDKPYKCSQCEKMFSQESSLKTHLRIHN